MRQVKNVLKYIASVFLVLLVSLCIYTFIMTDILKKDYVNVFGYSYFVVATGSMSGTIETDDVIFVRLTKNVKVNDIVTFKDEKGKIITHRLIDKRGSKYVTKGDVNNMADESITKEQIIGKVCLVISPSFILKSIAIFLIVFILLALVNFDNIVKKYIIRDDKKMKKLPNDIFISPKNRYDEPSSGLTVTIDIGTVEEMEKIHEEESAKETSAAFLAEDEYFSFEPAKKKSKMFQEKETIDFVVSILKCKKNNVAKARMNKKWLIKYQYIYKICLLLLINNTSLLTEEVSNPPFDEIYDYDLDRVGLTESMRNRIYAMPIYVFLRILTYTILYNDDEMFDGIYKILKYKIAVDKDENFKVLRDNDINAMNQVKTLISFMEKVCDKFDNKKVFELDKIERMVRIGNY